MISVLIADDESIVLEGLKCIIDWNELGFHISGEAKNGQEALEKIHALQPDLVLLDIRMPKLHGTDVIKLARESGYKGHFIIISGHSDFQYAQAALRYGTDYYLMKPIDDDELMNAVLQIKERIKSEYYQKSTLAQYREKAKDTILRDMLLGKGEFPSLDFHDLHLTASVYQIVIYKRYHQDASSAVYHFADIFKTNPESSDFVVIDGNQVILLKGESSLKRFQNQLKYHRENNQKDLSLYSAFITYGRPVYKLEHITRSYQDAYSLMKRCFFCKKGQHILSYEHLPNSIYYSYSIQSEEALNFHCKLADCIQSRNREKVVEMLHTLESNLSYAKEDISSIKHYLADIYLQVKQTISRKYHDVDIPFPITAFIIDFVDKKYFLHEIIQFFSDQFEIIMKAISNTSNESVLEDILYYIDHNYHENLKLESIAQLFGYNSSYLGKLFYKKAGVNFNVYLDQIRIQQSQQLLQESNLKVYEVSQQVGYTNVDYFHKKFKKYVGQSPAQYRKNIFVGQ